MTVPVAELRRLLDRLERIVHVDYHACVSADELRAWGLIAQRVQQQVAHAQSRRANADDAARREAVLHACEQRLERTHELVDRQAAAQGQVLRLVVPAAGACLRP